MLQHKSKLRTLPLKQEGKPKSAMKPPMTPNKNSLSVIKPPNWTKRKQSLLARGLTPEHSKNLVNNIDVRLSQLRECFESRNKLVPSVLSVNRQFSSHYESPRKVGCFKANADYSTPLRKTNSELPLTSVSKEEPSLTPSLSKYEETKEKCAGLLRKQRSGIRSSK